MGELEVSICRKLKGLFGDRKQEEIAALLGVDQSTVSRIIREVRYRFTIPEIVKFSQVFGVPVSYFMGGLQDGKISETFGNRLDIDPSADYISISIIGMVSAGTSADVTTSKGLGAMNIPKLLLPPTCNDSEQITAIKIDGTCLLSEGIRPGAYLILYASRDYRVGANLEGGNIVLCQCDKLLSRLQRILKLDGKVLFAPVDPDSREPLFAQKKGMSIVGKVIGAYTPFG